MTPSADPEAIIRRYYAAFNARRLDDAQALLASNAQIEHRTIEQRRGSDAYLTFARRWLTAFPDGRITIDSILAVGENWYEVALVGEGTHQGDFDMGPLGIIKATGVKARVSFRHLFEIRDGRITSSTLSFDTQDLIRQLAR